MTVVVLESLLGADLGADIAYVVDHLAMCVGEEQGEPIGKALLKTDLERMVGGIADARLQCGYILKLRKGAKQLSALDSGATKNRGGIRDDAIKRIGYGGEQRTPHAEVRTGNLIVVLRSHQVNAVVTNVASCEHELKRKLTLNVDRELLVIAHSLFTHWTGDIESEVLKQAQRVPRRLSKTGGKRAGKIELRREAVRKRGVGVGDGRITERVVDKVGAGSKKIPKPPRMTVRSSIW